MLLTQYSVPNTLVGPVTIGLHLVHAVAFKWCVNEINEELAQQTVLLFDESSVLP